MEHKTPPVALETVDQATNITACWHLATDDPPVWKLSDFGNYRILKVADKWVCVDQNGTIQGNPQQPQADAQALTPPEGAWIRRDGRDASLFNLRHSDDLKHPNSALCSLLSCAPPQSYYRAAGSLYSHLSARATPSHGSGMLNRERTGPDR